MPRDTDMQANFKRLDPEVEIPTRSHIGDAAVDLQARYDITLEPGERAAVPTGLAVAIPEGFAGLVLPRSGHARRLGVGVVNGPGLIDAVRAAVGGELRYVEVQGPLLRVNGKTYTATEACTDPMFVVAHPDTGSDVELQCSRVDMGGGWHFRGTVGKPNPSNDHKKRVGTNNVYLISDNRELHEDSRDFGTLPHASCHQRIFFRLWGAAGWSDVESRMTLIR